MENAVSVLAMLIAHFRNILVFLLGFAEMQNTVIAVL